LNFDVIREMTMSIPRPLADQLGIAAAYASLALVGAIVFGML
jgi:hypothetical protein